MTIKSASDYIPENKFLKVMLCGEIGTGKSELAKTFPQPGFVFMTDRKIGPYQGYCELLKANLNWDYGEYELSNIGYIDFEKDCNLVSKSVAEGKYKTVVLDSTTSFTDLVMERALTLDPKRSPTGGPIWNVHYAMVGNLVEGKIRKMLNMNCNLVIISHIEFIYDNNAKDPQIIAIEPMLTGKLSTKIPGYFEEVWAAFSRTRGNLTDYYIRTVPRGLYKARSEMRGRERLLPDEIPNDYPSVIKYYQEAIAKKRSSSIAK